MGYKEWRYDGPVKEFNKVIANRWTASTYATTESKARSNLTYQFKKQFNKAPNTSITLFGKLTQVGRKEQSS